MAFVSGLFLGMVLGESMSTGDSKPYIPLYEATEESDHEKARTLSREVPLKTIEQLPTACLKIQGDPNFRKYDLNRSGASETVTTLCAYQAIFLHLALQTKAPKKEEAAALPTQRRIR